MNLETGEIQGIVISGYAHLPASSHLLISTADRAEAKTWLGKLMPEITSSDWSKGKPQQAVNLAFTHAGLSLFGVPEGSLKMFSQEFREGMSHPTRAKKLGDVNEDGQDHWDICMPSPPEASVHILLILQAAGRADLKALETRHLELLADFPGLRLTVKPQHGFTSKDSKEPFGFRDSITQPQIEGSPKLGKVDQPVIKAGEFILGYENEYGHRPPSPTIPPTDPEAPAGTDDTAFAFGRNGSYLVFRKLEQDVEGFLQFSLDHANGRDPMYVAAKMVGRWPSGLPLVTFPEKDDPELADSDGFPLNSFNYAQTDPAGLNCPIGAHIRRMNPRDAMENRPPDASLKDVRRHQIVRRGTTYQEPEDGQGPGVRRGLLFLCINADIRRQFEFIQQTWGDNPFFRGLRNDPDPLVGTRSQSVERRSGCPISFTIQQPLVRERLTSLPKFVRLRGGEYFFIPSLSALGYLAEEKTSMPV